MISQLDITTGSIRSLHPMATAAARTVPSLVGRAISPPTLRQSTAMPLLLSGVDSSVIALWLSHESPTTTHQYVEADLAMREKALSRLQDPQRRRAASEWMTRCWISSIPCDYVQRRVATTLPRTGAATLSVPAQRVITEACA